MKNRLQHEKHADLDYAINQLKSLEIKSSDFTRWPVADCFEKTLKLVYCPVNFC